LRAHACAFRIARTVKEGIEIPGCLTSCREAGVHSSNKGPGALEESTEQDQGTSCSVCVSPIQAAGCCMHEHRRLLHDLSGHTQVCQINHDAEKKGYCWQSRRQLTAACGVKDEDVHIPGKRLSISHLACVEEQTQVQCRGMSLRM
jgi:hypothetical protein